MKDLSEEEWAWSEIERRSWNRFHPITGRTVDEIVPDLRRARRLGMKSIMIPAEIYEEYDRLLDRRELVWDRWGRANAVYAQKYREIAERITEIEDEYFIMAKVTPPDER